jgi:phospholipid transport system substrate-binding protein
MLNVMKNNSFIMNTVLCVLFFLCVVSPHPAFAASPTDELRPTLDGIVDIITNPTYAGAENKELRRNKIMVVAKRGFDFTTMSKLVLGKTYRKLDEQQRKRFEELFTKLLENAYIGKLEGYTNQVTKYEGERIKGKKAEVRTQVENKGVSLPVSYIMLQNNSGWQVYDIKIEGVRLLRNYKAQFKSILRTDKFEGLVKILEEKNASFGKEGNS